MSDIHYLDAAAGTGKTFHMVRKVVNDINKKKSFIIVMPTQKMVDDVATQINEVDPSVIVEKFHVNNVEGRVTSAVTDYLKNPREINHVVIITAQCLNLMNYFHRPQDWNLIEDEVPDVFQMFDPHLLKNHRVFTECVVPVCHGPDLGYSNLDVLDATKLRSLKENTSHDDVDAVYQPLARAVLSDDHQTYILNTNYDMLLSGNANARKLLLFSVRRPRLYLKFASCLIMAACFKETLVFKIWNKMGVNFVEDLDLRAALNSTTHHNGNRVSLYYGYDANWSKTAKDEKRSNVTKNYVAAGQNFIGQSECLLLGNKNCRHTQDLSLLPNFVRLPGKSHGQNQYQHIDHVFASAAYNLQPACTKFLEVMFGIDRASAKRSIMSYEIYQAVMRSSLRDRTCNSYSIVVVPDKATAEFLSGLFPGSSCQSLGLEQPATKVRGRKPIHSSPAEKQRMSREKLKAEREGFVKEIKLATDSDLRGVYGKERDENTLKSIGKNVSLCKGTIFENIKIKSADKTLYVCDEGPFIHYLRQCSKRKIAVKEDNEAISPSIFRHDPNYSTETGSVNVWFANGIWMDLDNTELKPNDLAKIFPNIKFVAFSTFSHTKENCRYRVWIPTSDIMSNQHYRNIIRQIVQKIEATGTYIQAHDPTQPHMKAHGIDHKTDASNKFYLPCKPEDGGTGIFRVFNGEGRLPLDVDDWLENSVVPFDDEIPAIAFNTTNAGLTDELTPLQTHIAEAALAKFQSAPRGSGHVMFYNLHRRLLHNGILGVHWEVIMSQAVQSSNSPDKRKGEMELYRKQMWRVNCINEAA